MGELSINTHRQHRWVEREVDGTGIASGVDGQPGQLQDRGRRPHHHLVRLRSPCIATFQKELPGASAAPRRDLWGRGEVGWGEEPEAGVEPRGLRHRHPRRGARAGEHGEEVRGYGLRGAG